MDILRIGCLLACSMSTFGNLVNCYAVSDGSLMICKLTMVCQLLHKYIMC
jgi:hypothetical protein